MPLDKLYEHFTATFGGRSVLWTPLDLSFWCDVNRPGTPYERIDRSDLCEARDECLKEEAGIDRLADEQERRRG